MTVRTRSCDRKNCERLVKKIGKTKRDIACEGLTTNVKRPMAAAGNPMPRNPFTMPEIKKVATIKTNIVKSFVGINKLKIESSNGSPIFVNDFCNFSYGSAE